MASASECCLSYRVMTDNQTLTASASARPPLRSGKNPPEHILVVEDDPSIRELNSSLLERSGYVVDVAADGAAAWQALGADSYDLMITDNNMPKLTGVELLKKLHAARLDMPVIMATGKLPTEEFARYPWLQPTATLLKPYTIEDLLRAVKKVLREVERTTKDVQRIMARTPEDYQIPPTVKPAGTTPAGPAHSSPRILVVDEDRDLRQLYAEALAGPGYAVDVAEDGDVGWEALQAKPYNLLITEHDMPKLTGVELVRKLRAAHMALPVVMAAARLPTDELARNPSLQLTATLVKPFSIGALLDTVKNILRATVSPGAPTNALASWGSQPATGGLRLS